MEEKGCTYWADYNQRILDDLLNEEARFLKFPDLIFGQLKEQEEFMGIELSQRKREPGNANKLTGMQGLAPSFAEGEQRTIHKDVYRIFDPVMGVLEIGV